MERKNWMYQRTLGKFVKKASSSFAVLLVTGPRQVGKSTLLKMCSEDNRSFISLDDLEARELAQRAPSTFTKRFKPPLIIGEIQYAPQLFNYLRRMAVRRKKNGLYWLTSSHKFHLMKGITDYRAGDVAILDLLGLSQAELDDRADQTINFVPSTQWINRARSTSPASQDLIKTYDKIWQGSFPAVHQPEVLDRDNYYHKYIQTYFERDVRDILRISDVKLFQKFMVAAAARTGQLLNYAELAKDVAIDNKTAKTWLTILETTGLVYLLYPYQQRFVKRLAKTPKLYFLDSGLCSYLAGWPNAASLEFGAMSDSIYKTYLFAEILKTYWHNGRKAPLYFYRDLGQNEIDLVIEIGSTLHPVTFKKTTAPLSISSKNFLGLQRLDKKVGRGGVVCLVEKSVQLSRKATAVPVWYL